MADQMINQLPVKTAPQTGDKFLVVGAAEEQLIDYDKLADAILNKLTSKAYSLEQGTKSLVAALNELNSKTKKKTASCVLPEGMSRNAGHSYSANNIVFINESLTATSALKKGDSIVSDIKIDGESINAKWAYGIVIDPDNSSETCLLSGNTIEFRGNNTISGAFSLIVIGSYE